MHETGKARKSSAVFFRHRHPILRRAQSSQSSRPPIPVPSLNPSPSPPPQGASHPHAPPARSRLPLGSIPLRLQSRRLPSPPPRPALLVRRVGIPLPQIRSVQASSARQEELEGRKERTSPNPSRPTDMVRCSHTTPVPNSAISARSRPTASISTRWRASPLTRSSSSSAGGGAADSPPEATSHGGGAKPRATVKTCRDDEDFPRALGVELVYTPRPSLQPALHLDSRQLDTSKTEDSQGDAVSRLWSPADWRNFHTSILCAPPSHAPTPAPALGSSSDPRRRHRDAHHRPKFGHTHSQPPWLARGDLLPNWGSPSPVTADALSVQKRKSPVGGDDVSSSAPHQRPLELDKRPYLDGRTTALHVPRSRTRTRERQLAPPLAQLSSPVRQATSRAGGHERQYGHANVEGEGGAHCKALERCSGDRGPKARREAKGKRNRCGRK
ncbi:hypothetical protein MSAN_01215300 [Mycena sanguinolenta]|uniref:Uncharacterized protein n=1 Tax=Mycena sanguinolenta TaxID=230812 RepID=A0A8H6YFI5_9AGAR|nr:hypothetical protein MSAN_01215300 [Mycena sanguinolenta]